MAFVTPYETDKFTVYQGDVIEKNVSLVVQLLDDFTRKQAIGSLKVSIDERNIEPVKNPSGYYVFTGLEEPLYKVKIRSEFYFIQEKEIKRQDIRILDIQLKFGNKGPAAWDTTIKLKSISQLKIGDLIEFRSYTGKTEQKEITTINASKKEISWAGGLKYNFNAPDDCIIALKNPVFPFFLKPLPSYPFSSYATLIRGIVKYPGKKSSKKKLEEDSRESPVTGARVKVPELNIETESDEKGEFVVYFSEIKNEKISIEITKKDEKMPVNIILKDITLKEGAMRSLVTIVSQ